MKNFLQGILSIFDLGGYQPDMNWRDDRSDAEKLYRDWKAVGDDMRKAIREFEKAIEEER